MIWESAPWKHQLKQDASHLRQLNTVPIKDDADSELFKLERLVFVAAYAMRKLWESKKLSTNWNDLPVHTVRYPIIGHVPDLMNWHRLDEHYDFDNGVDTRIKREELCDRLIHSFIFTACFGEHNEVDSFFFASDKTRKQAVWRIQLNDFIELMLATGDDFPTSSHKVRGEDGQWIVWAGHGEPPKGWVKSTARSRK
jgi:hypothetical protein